MKKQEWFTPIYQRMWDENPLEFKDYLINEQGKVFSKKQGKRMKPTTDSNGYYVYGLRLNNKTYYCLAARLVAFTFIPNDDRFKKSVVNHIDGNITHNHKSNLEWVTHAENTQKYHDLKKSGGKNEDVYDKNYYIKVKNQLTIFDELNE